MTISSASSGMTAVCPWSRDERTGCYQPTGRCELPVRSVDAERPADEVRRIMEEQGLDVACLRRDGLVAGFVRRNDLDTGSCMDHLRPFRPGQVLPGDGSLSELVRTLTVHEHVFVSRFGDVGAVAGRACINAPVVRMWLFGIITLSEMLFAQLIEQLFPDGSWQTFVAPNRHQKALALQQERERRGQHSRLLDCLQLSDKGQVLVDRPEMLQFFGFDSKRTAKKLVKELESLRNNLAHSQDIVTHDWAAIARIASSIEGAVHS